jgi:hypothetical protein
MMLAAIGPSLITHRRSTMCFSVPAHELVLFSHAPCIAVTSGWRCILTGSLIASSSSAGFLRSFVADGAMVPYFCPGCAPVAVMGRWQCYESKDIAATSHLLLQCRQMSHPS